MSAHFQIVCEPCFRKVYPGGAEEICLGPMFLGNKFPCALCGTLVGENDKWHWMRTDDVLANGGRVERLIDPDDNDPEDTSKEVY